MTLKELYTELDADYEGVLGRLCNETLVDRFVNKFVQDPSSKLLIDSVEAENWEEAFRAAHTLKGVSLNLGFTQLNVVSDKLTEALRGGKALEDMALYEAVKQEYDKTIAAITQYKNQK